MNWCQPHWDQLREAVRLRGLDGFIAKDGEQAAENMINQLEGEDEVFDPLMGSWVRINLEMAESLTRAGRGHEILQMRCPMCLLVEDGQPELVQNWIDGCTDNAKSYAIEQGLIKAN